MKPWQSAPRLRVVGIVSLVALAHGPAGCAQPMKMGKAPNIVIPLERKPPPGDAPPPRAPAEEAQPLVHHAPDPAPARSADQVDLLLRFEGGKLKVLGSQRVHLPSAESTPRRMGRFAAELWLGAELLERLRFDVPLLGADGGDALESGLEADVTIRLPLLQRANRLEIIDRKTEERLTLEWPPA
jgi:hypothetical protein